MSLQTKTPGAGKQPGATIESGRRNFTASHIARGIACGLLVSASAFFTGVSLTRCTSHASHGTITPAPVSLALVLQNTKSEAVATPTDKRGFVTFDIQSGAGVPSVKDGFRAGWGYPQGCPHGFGRVLNIPPTNDRFKTGAGGFLHVPEGA